VEWLNEIAAAARAAVAWSVDEKPIENMHGAIGALLRLDKRQELSVDQRRALELMQWLTGLFGWRPWLREQESELLQRVHAALLPSSAELAYVMGWRLINDFAPRFSNAPKGKARDELAQSLVIDLGASANERFWRLENRLEEVSELLASYAAPPYAGGRKEPPAGFRSAASILAQLSELAGNALGEGTTVAAIDDAVERLGARSTSGLARSDAPT
jgi:hypothetical protein